MSRRRQTPLVYATQASSVQAATVLPGAALENEVCAAIIAGRVKLASGHGTVTGPGWQATVVRIEPRLRSRPRRPRPWLVTSVSDEPVSTDKEAHDD